MAKKQSKREVLSLLLSEVAKLRGEVKGLGKELAAVAERVKTLAPKAKTEKAPRPASKTRAKSRRKAPASAKAPPGPETARKAGAAPKRPVLVSPAAGAAAQARSET